MKRMVYFELHFVYDCVFCVRRFAWHLFKNYEGCIPDIMHIRLPHFCKVLNFVLLIWDPIWSDILWWFFQSFQTTFTFWQSAIPHTQSWSQIRFVALFDVVLVVVIKNGIDFVTFVYRLRKLIRIRYRTFCCSDPTMLLWLLIVYPVSHIYVPCQQY